MNALTDVMAIFSGTESRLAELQAKSLARIVADLINDNEPLLKAEADQATVTVRERGGPGAFSINVCPRKERQ
jgi:hypothetical protein